MSAFPANHQASDNPNYPLMFHWSPAYHKLQNQHQHQLLVCISIHPFFPLLIFHLHPKKNYIHSSNSLQMASITSSLVSIPSFTGLKSARATSSRVTATAKVSAAPAPRLSLKASLKEVGVAVVATAASALLLASNAMALDVLLGSDDGGLAFVPSEFSVSSGEKITFKNNKGFPHNVVFDEDEVPSGVDVSKISMSEEDLLNAEGETFSVTLTTKGTYKFYCAPHQGAGMVGQVTVN